MFDVTGVNGHCSRNPTLWGSLVPDLEYVKTKKRRLYQEPGVFYTVLIESLFIWSLSSEEFRKIEFLLSSLKDE